MTWQNFYTVNLNSDFNLGANSFNYVAKIPAINQTDNFIRLALRSPNAGQSRVQNMYIGHGTDYSFDGNQKPVTVGEQSTFTLNGGLTYSDPINVTSINFDSTKDIIIAYGLLNGDVYRGNTSASGRTLYWKLGTGDSANTTKTGYTVGSNRTALIENIQLVDVVPDEQEEPEVIYKKYDNAEQVINGERHSTGGEIEAQPGKYTHIQFRNPSTSGKIGLLYEVELFPTADTIVSIRAYNGILGVTFPIKCNLMFGAGQGLMEGRYSYQDAVLGNFHSIHKIKANQRNIIHLDVPLVGIVAGVTTVLIAFHSPNVGAVANIQWRELTNNQ
jgi:hypothetical protein